MFPSIRLLVFNFSHPKSIISITSTAKRNHKWRFDCISELWNKHSTGNLTISTVSNIIVRSSTLYTIWPFWNTFKSQFHCMFVLCNFSSENVETAVPGTYHCHPLLGLFQLLPIPTEHTHTVSHKPHPIIEVHNLWQERHVQWTHLKSFSQFILWCALSKWFKWDLSYGLLRCDIT